MNSTLANVLVEDRQPSNVLVADSPTPVLCPRSGPILEATLPNVLVVDDEPFVRSFLRQALQPSAARVVEADHAAAALESIESGGFDIVVCDIWMPGASGLDLLAIAQQSQWDVGFILVTGQLRLDTVMTALRLQASDFLLKPLTVEEVTRAVARAFERLLTVRQARAYRAALESGIQRRTHELAVALSQLESNYQMTLEALVASLDAREHETFSHSLRVRAYTELLARAAGYPLELMPALEQGALLHDIGKIAVADAILLKPAPLTDAEWVEMRKHPLVGESILQRVPFLRPACTVVRHHHERHDGSGYPDGLKGAEIPLGARLFAVADTLDAITTDRPYRKGMGYHAARTEITRCRGRQFDPAIVDVFLKIPASAWAEARDNAPEGYALAA
jgi:putative nucleotidyltransferase with HDIG domain